MNRRDFLAAAGAMAAPLLTPAAAAAAVAAISERKLERVAVASSTYRANFDGLPQTVDSAAPRLNFLTLPGFVRRTTGVRRLELWGRQFGERGHTEEHYRAIRAAADAAGVTIANLQVEDLPSLNQAELAARAEVLEACMGWMDKASILGANSIRVNVTRRPGPIDLEAVVGLLRQAAAYGRTIGVRLLLENHGGYTESIPNLISLVQAVNDDYCRITIDWGAWSPPGDRYEAMQSAMPYVHIVSAKGTIFDETTLEHTAFDVGRLVRNAEAAGFRGLYSIELYWTPAPKDTNAAVRSHIKTITDNIT